MSFIRPSLTLLKQTQHQFRLVAALSTSRRVMAAAAASSPTEMTFTFASAGEVFYNAVKTVKQVDVPSLSGSFGILAQHVPTLAVLKPGVVTVHEQDGKVSRPFFLPLYLSIRFRKFLLVKYIK